MKILLTSNHPGGTAAVLPVAAKLTEIGAACVGVTTARSAPAYDAAGVSHHVVDSPVGAREARHLIETHAPDFLLAATSEPGDPRVGRLETRLLAEAARVGVPTAAVLDHWCGYRERFSLDGAGSLDVVPEVVCVMDDRARSDLQAVGFPADRLVVTGNPAWDRLRDVRVRLERQTQEELRCAIGLPPGQHVYVFVSQPISEDGVRCGYTETE